VPDASPKVSSALTNVAETKAGGLAPEATWPGRAALLEAIEHWDRRLWQRLDDIITPPGTPGKRVEPPLYKLVPEEDRWANEKHERRAWVEAVALLKQKTKSGAGYILQVLDIGEPSAQPQIASDEWIETILPREVSFADSQILRNQRVFGARVSTRRSEPAKIPEHPHRTVDKGGRPDKFLWDEFWFEVCRIANTPDGLPEQREFNKHMLEWASQNWRDPPGDSTIRNKIAALYRALH
jgi:hypothetical protein